MIGVVIPAHNEERHISECLASVRLASEHPALQGQRVEILVVLDACSDGTVEQVAARGASMLEVCFQNVGKARAVGAEHLLEAGVQWLAFTDADTRVPCDWLVRQIECGADAVCGTVEVDSWSEHDESVRSRYLELYQFIENHRHIHGANLGLSADAYRNAGGFQHLVTHEDVRLVADLERTGARIAWTATNPVITSARRDYKCRGGFGEYLMSMLAPHGPELPAGGPPLVTL
ncbi:glycosyl transferase [Pseudomonas fluorescens]|uniref:Glycosyltransferase family 2 protein n=1 Tax=Pseudomonas fluorescens TaxID=294 RepID=A0A1B3D724_PSEFL|nr:glycosyltransferase family 2 protein [Pseudomonas fluorescens]AOE67261.1 glycosyl transferase [Pseudomonas fluorescens]AOE73093.1 glycosyl transferase [Pseudomonas fluorescens]QOU07518.1 glycosyltransferase family 2 protein [Pseudomonas fluorescens]